jgi:thymidylate synthase
MNNLDKKYQQLLSDIIEFGVEKTDRTGTGTISEFGHQIRHKMSEGFPLLTTKKMAWKQIVSELLWFLRGDTNIEFLHQNNNHIWDGDYNKSGRTDGELGPIYGHQWRNWGGWKEVKFTGEKDENGYLIPSYTNHIGIDQISNLIQQLKTNPDSRRLMVNAWNVGDLEKMTLPPCHYGFQVYTRELSLEERVEIARKTLSKETFYEYGNLSPFTTPIITYWLNQHNIPIRAISLMWNQRSVDTFLGLPFNIASYGLLLEIIAKEVNMIPDELIGNLGDTHLYLNHIQQAKEQISRTPYELPTLKIESEVKWKEGDCLPTYSVEHLTLENYQSHPTIKAPLSN